MTHTVTLAASGSYDIDSDFMRVVDCQVTNIGPGTVYYGDIPDSPVVLQCDGDGVSLSYTGSGAATESRAYTDVRQGMVATGDGITGSVVITKVRGKEFLTDGAPSSAGDLITFTPPAISASNGHPILEGETVRFSAAAAANRNQPGRRFVADGSGAVLTISNTRA
jgi:hypothetical protein